MKRSTSRFVSLMISIAVTSLTVYLSCIRDSYTPFLVGVVIVLLIMECSGWE